MDQITFDEIRNKHHFLEWVLIHAITLKDAVPDIKRNPDDGGVLTLKFEVNDVELPILKTFKDLEKQDEERIRKEAAKLIEEKLGNLDDLLSDLSDGARGLFYKKLGVEVKDDDY